MILDDRYALTLFCNLDFESATVLQRRQSKRASEDETAFN